MLSRVYGFIGLKITKLDRVCIKLGAIFVVLLIAVFGIASYLQWSDPCKDRDYLFDFAYDDEFHTQIEAITVCQYFDSDSSKDPPPLVMSNPGDIEGLISRLDARNGDYGKPKAQYRLNIKLYSGECGGVLLLWHSDLRKLVIVDA